MNTGRRRGLLLPEWRLEGNEDQKSGETRFILDGEERISSGSKNKFVEAFAEQVLCRWHETSLAVT